MNKSIDTTTKKLAFTGLFIALTFVMTIVLRVPSPTGGYINVGDCAVLTAGVILGPVYGTIAACLGSVISDIVASAFVFAPGTLVIKGLMALLVGLLYKKCKNNIHTTLLFALCEIIMVAGYFIYDAFIVGLLGADITFAAAIEELPGNTIQGVLGIILGIMLKKLIEDILIKMNTKNND